MTRRTPQRSSAHTTRVWTLVTALAVAMGSAHADNSSPSRVAIESHVGARLKEIQAPMSYLRSALERRGFAATPASIRRMLGVHIPGPGIADPNYTARAFSDEVDAAGNLMVAEDYKGAIKKLLSALDAIDRNPLIVAKDPATYALRLEAMTYLARAYDLAGNRPAADKTMTELIRLHPDKVLTATNDGSRAETIYKSAKLALDRAGRGELLVEVHDRNGATDPSVGIYVDGVGRGRGAKLMGDMIAGRVTVVLENQARIARVFRPRVLANQRTRLKINWELDSVFVISDWVGFLFTLAQDQEEDGKLAASLAADRTTAVAVAVLSATVVERKIEVTGALHMTPSGVETRRGSVTLSGSGDNKKLDQLAAFLAEGTRHANVRELPLRNPPKPESSPKIVERKGSWDRDSPFMPIRPGAPDPEPSPAPVRGDETTASSERRSPAGPVHRHSGWEWAYGIAGGALMASGAVVFALDRAGEYDAPWGVGEALAIGGGACVATAVAMHFYDKSLLRHSVIAAPVNGGMVGAVGWRF